LSLLGRAAKLGPTMPPDRRSTGLVEVFTFGARLDAACAGPAREEIKSAIADGRHLLVLDLGRVRFMDSSGLFALIASLKEARAAGGGVALIGLSREMRTVIEVARLHHVFEICEDEAAAVAILGAPR
jgi:anti-sigma B factor antagonist